MGDAGGYCLPVPVQETPEGIRFHVLQLCRCVFRPLTGAFAPFHPSAPTPMPSTMQDPEDPFGSTLDTCGPKHITFGRRC